MRLKKIDAKIDIEKRPLVTPKKLGEKLREKGPETKVEIIEKLEGNPGKGPVKEATGKEIRSNQKAPRKAIKRGGSSTASPSS